MISFKRLPHAIDTSVVALIISHLILWFYSMGGSQGVTDSSTYPYSLFVVPVVVWVTALAVFYLVIYPLAIGVAYACNQIRLSRLHGFFFFLVAAAVLAAWPAHAFGGINPMATWLVWIGYLSVGFAAFWHNGTGRA